MARQTWAALAALYPDNTAGAISPADLRAGLIDTMRPHVTSSAPDASDDETLGFDVGHAWIDTSTNPASVYECVDASTGAAVWVKRFPQDVGSEEVAADGVSYDNAESGLAAEDVQAAIDELASEKANSADLGTAAAADASDFATAAQGALADTAMQPGDELTALAATGITAGYVPKADGANGIVWAEEAGGGGGGGGIDPSDGLVVVQHGAVAATARPTAAVVYWMGSVAPDNKQTGDLWLETGAFD